tara:strand:+ start:28304 stop:28741 length:438 start_codon:yes stop_codon:yes gene_type:complete
VTVFTYDDLPDWVAKVDAVMDAVIAQATSDAMASIKIAPGINRGGTRERGVIPRDLGPLAASLQSTLYGSSALSQTGQESFALVAGAMRAGDAAEFSWGGPAAPYAHPVHYGANGLDGTYWIDEMALGWSGFMDGAVAKVRAELE